MSLSILVIPFEVLGKGVCAGAEGEGDLLFEIHGIDPQRHIDFIPIFVLDD